MKKKLDPRRRGGFTHFVATLRALTSVGQSLRRSLPNAPCQSFPTHIVVMRSWRELLRVVRRLDPVRVRKAYSRVPGRREALTVDDGLQVGANGHSTVVPGHGAELQQVA